MLHPHAVTLLAAALATASTGCGTSENPVVGVDYTVSEFPGGGKVPWSCLAEGHIDGAGAAGIAWSVGTPLVATPTPRFARACGGLMGDPCPDPQMVMAPLAGGVWTVAPGPTPSTWLGGSSRYLEAVTAGLGGMTVQAQGRAFPALELQSVAPSGFRFFQVTIDSGGPSLAPIVDRLVVASGAHVTIVPQLVAAGARLCGFPAMTVTATGPAVAPDPTWNPEGRANAPLVVTGGAAGKIELSAGGASGTLLVDSN